MILLDPEKDAPLYGSLAMWPYVVPTKGKRYALARALYEVATQAQHIGAPGALALKRACLARIRILTRPGDFDAEAYDIAAGFPYAFAIDWWTHALAQALYRAQAAP